MSRRPVSRGAKVLALTGTGVFMAALDVSIVNVAFTDIVDDFGTDSRRLLTWIFSGYNIAYAAGLLTAGRLADSFGRKRAFLTGLAVFAVGSLLCALSPTPGVLVAARVVQALGGSMLTPASLALVLPEFPVEKRSAAIGLWGAIGGIAAASGPSLGGWLVEQFGWHSVFLINLPVSALAIVIGLRLLRESRDPSASRRPDVVGAALAMSGVALLVLVIVQSDVWGWTSTTSLAVLVASMVLSAAFVVRCQRVEDPILDLRLLALPFVQAASAAGLLFSMGFFAMFFTNVQWLQNVWGYSATSSGLAMTPGPLTAALVAAPAGRLAQQVGHGRVITVGAVLLGGGIAVLNLAIEPTASYWTLYFPVMVVTGAGVGLCISTLSSAATAYLPVQRFAMGSALNMTFRQVGAALGLAVVGSLLTASLRSDDPLSGFHHAWWFITASVWLAGIVMIALFRPPTAEQLAAATDEVHTPVPTGQDTPVPPSPQ